MMKKKLSVIIPVYNSETYLPALFQSLNNQNQNLIEIIFVNDGSSDKSQALLLEYMEGKSNVVVFTQENKGGSAARNLGLHNAKGEYILFFDSDDTLKYNVLEVLINEMELNKADILIGNMIRVQKYNSGIMGKPIFRKQYSEDNEKLFFLDGYPGNKLYKKSIIDKYNILFAEVKIIQDVNFYLKYAAHCQKIQFTDVVFYNYLLRDNSVSGSSDIYITDVVKSIKDVKRHYIKYGLYLYYDKLIEYCLVRYITYQFHKIPNLKKLRDKAVVYLYFRKILKRINMEDNRYINDIYKNQVVDFLNHWEMILVR